MNKLLILAGGLGTRLKSALPELPKVLAPIENKPFIHYIIEHYQKNGIDEFVFLLGYKSDLIIQYIDNNFSDLPKNYVIEKDQLGTGGAIQLGLQSIEDENVFITNGDTFFDVDINEMKKLHINVDCTIALKPMSHFERYGSVTVDSNNHIECFNEKKYCESGLINGGVYLINRNKFLHHLLPFKFSFEKDYLENSTLVKNMMGYISEGYFIDIGIPEDYRKAQNELPTIV
jgi:D-glycero-alpha-D-manno-heptose 1-phosphate guanylyltransferase